MLKFAALNSLNDVVSHFGLTFHIDNEFATLSLYTLYFNLASHLLNQIFADRQTKSDSIGILPLILFDLAEVHKQLINFVFWYAHPVVFNHDVKA